MGLRDAKSVVDYLRRLADEIEAEATPPNAIVTLAVTDTAGVVDLKRRGWGNSALTCGEVLCLAATREVTGAAGGLDPSPPGGAEAVH